MKLDNMFKKTRGSSGEKGYTSWGRTGPAVPEGLLRKCNKCGSAIIAEDVRRDFYICSKCGGYFRVHACRRIEMLADEGTFEEWDKELQGGNPLSYKGYEEKLAGLKEKTGLTEAVVTGKMCINGSKAVVGVCDGRFLMASMGEAVGEKITRAVERATKEDLPVIFFCVLRRCKDAGGNCIPYADGKDGCGAEASQRRRTSLYQCPDRPYHGRRDGKLCYAWRYHSG